MFLNGTPNESGCLSQYKYIESGCNVSGIIDDSIWDYRNNNFKDIGVKTKFFLCRLAESIGTYNGLKFVYFVYLKESMYVSLDKLNFVPITLFTVSMNETDKEMPLVGLDILTKYTMIFSIFDGRYQLRIINQREEA